MSYATLCYRLGVVIVMVFIALPVLAAGNVAEKFALVIGNRDYSRADQSLPNAARDAELMAESLRKLGFQVSERRNLKRADFVSAVSDFAERLPEGATAFVYYAGHGMQIGGNNFLTPVDLAPTSEQTISVKSYPLKALLDRLSSSKSAVNIVVLDACRNNPFQPHGAIRYRSFADLGLAPVQAPRGTLVAYSTSPGQLAADGQGKNSVYTESLAKALLQPKRELEETFKGVGGEVRKRTMDDQIPWYESSLTEKYYFQPPEGITVVPGKSPQVASLAKDTAVRRGDTAREAAPENAWFRQLTAAEWSNIDWEIQQRVKHLTPDEISALEHKAKGGSVLAQTTLGLAYREGLERATDQGSGKVMRFKSNNSQALRWLRKAAEAGFPVAQTELGEMYYGGRGVERNLDEARRWLELAAAALYPRARLDLFQLKVQMDPLGANAEEGLKGLVDSAFSSYLSF